MELVGGKTALKERMREPRVLEQAEVPVEGIHSLSEAKMCLCTVYMASGNEQEEIMKDVARIEAEGQGFWLINLFGEKTFVEGTIQTVDLMDGHFVMLEKKSPPDLFF